MARAGGICTFLMIGLIVLALLLVLVGQRNPLLAGIGGLLLLIAFGLWFFVMIAIKVDLDQNGFPRTGPRLLPLLRPRHLFRGAVNGAGGNRGVGNPPRRPRRSRRNPARDRPL